MSISVEVIDSSNGRPAAGIGVELWRGDDAQWHELADGRTDEDRGALTLGNDPHTPGAPTTPVAIKRGRYRLRLEVDPYFAGLGIMPLQSTVEVVFRVFDPEQHIHLLMMITPSSCETHVLPRSAPPTPRPAPPNPQVEHVSAGI